MARRLIEREPQDALVLLARHVVKTALEDWRLAGQGRVRYAALNGRWRRTPEELRADASQMQTELREWFIVDEPGGLAWWCDIAELSVDAVRETTRISGSHNAGMQRR